MTAGSSCSGPRARRRSIRCACNDSALTSSPWASPRSFRRKGRTRARVSFSRERHERSRCSCRRPPVTTSSGGRASNALEILVLLLSLAGAVGCRLLSPAEPSAVAQGRYFSTGNPNYDEFFVRLHRMQVELKTAPETLAMRPGRARARTRARGSPRMRRPFARRSPRKRVEMSGRGTTLALDRGREPGRSRAPRRDRNARRSGPPAREDARRRARAARRASRPFRCLAERARLAAADGGRARRQRGGGFRRPEPWNARRRARESRRRSESRRADGRRA